MKSIPRYKFYKTKYGEELLIDVVTLDSIKQHIQKHPVHTLSYFDITFITCDTGGFSIEDQHYSLCRGDVLFSRPGEVRAWDENFLPQGYALLFEEEFLLSFFNDRFFIRNLAYFSPDRVLAKLRLAYTTLTVAEIAEYLHFENTSYFIRLFRKQTNLTPLQYRRSLIR